MSEGDARYKFYKDDEMNGRTGGFKRRIIKINIIGK